MAVKYLRLNKPEGTLTQRFGGNATSIYNDQGLIGHTGEDWYVGFKKDIKAVVDGEIYSTINLRSNDPTRYTAIYQLVETIDFAYEVSYGHINECFVEIGDMVKAGDIIATEGNRGDVFFNGIAPTLAQRALGLGSHLHFQIRKCIRVPERTRGKQYLKNAKGYLKKDGKYYEVVDYDNGYNGCTDPSMFYEISLSFVIKLLKLLGLIK